MAEAHRDEIAKLEALYAANPEGRVFTHLAEAYRKAGELERAVDVLEAGLQRHPESASAYIVLGRVRHDQGEREQAGQAFRRALELDNGNLVAHRYLADMAVEDDAPDEALRHYRELLNRSPGDEQLQQRIHALSRPEPEPAEPESPTLSEEEHGAAVAAEAEAGAVAYDPSPESFEAASELPGDLGTLAKEQGTQEPGSARLEEAELAGPEESGFGHLEEAAFGEGAEATGVEGLEMAGEGSSPESGFDGTAYGDLVLDDAVPGETGAAVPGDAGVDGSPEEAPADVGLDFSGFEEPAAAGEEETAPELVLDVDDLETPTGEETLTELPLLDLAPDPVEGVLEDEAAYPLEPEPDWAALEPGAAEAPAPGLATETMAELYRTQGFHGRAAEVYRSLLRERGDDERLRQRLAEVEALAESVRAEPEPESVESAFTGGGGATGEQETPYAWAGREEVAEPGEPIRDYFRSLLGWQGPAGPVEPELGDAPGGGVMEPPAARVEAPAWPVIERRGETEAEGTGELVLEAEGTGELVLEDAVEESGWTPEEIRLERSEPMPWDEPSGATPAPDLPPTPPSTSEDLMPWDLPEPPGLEAAPEEPTEWPETEPGSATEAPAQDAGGDEDEDLEMFRSWLQSLKK